MPEGSEGATEVSQATQAPAQGDDSIRVPINNHRIFFSMLLELELETSTFPAELQKSGQNGTEIPSRVSEYYVLEWLVFISFLSPYSGFKVLELHFFLCCWSWKPPEAYHNPVEMGEARRPSAFAFAASVGRNPPLGKCRQHSG